MGSVHFDLKLYIDRLLFCRGSLKIGLFLDCSHVSDSYCSYSETL